MSNNISPRTLTDRDAARYLGISESWLRQSRMNGNPDAPPFVRLGRAVRYLRDDLDRWLEARRQTWTGQSMGAGS